MAFDIQPALVWRPSRVPIKNERKLRNVNENDFSPEIRAQA